MNKQEASAFLKELLTTCKIESDSYIFIDPNPQDALSTGFKIRLKTVLNNEGRYQLKEITKKYNLAVIEEQNQITVYKPKSNNRDNIILK